MVCSVSDGHLAGTVSVRTGSAIGFVERHWFGGSMTKPVGQRGVVLLQAPLHRIVPLHSPQVSPSLGGSFTLHPSHFMIPLHLPHGLPRSSGVGSLQLPSHLVTPLHLPHGNPALALQHLPSLVQVLVHGFALQLPSH
jgi:hypothetical protein